jgi:hypothetical protein
MALQFRKHLRAQALAAFHDLGHPEAACYRKEKYRLSTPQR